MTASWFRNHLVGELLPLWLESSTTADGAFIPHLDRAWRRTRDAPLTLVSQARLIRNFAAGHRITGDPRYHNAVQTGTRWLLEHFADPVHGGWHWSATTAGDRLDRAKSAYGHAFVLYGLAHAHEATGDPETVQAAIETLACIDSRLRDRHGGLVPLCDEQWRDLNRQRSQNPIMHLFEALVALATIGRVPLCRARAASLARWVLAHLVRDEDGLIPEAYDHGWCALPASSGGRIDIGHQFEWAYLLSRAAELDVFEPSERGAVLAAASRLISAGLEIGYDPDDGGVSSPADPGGVLLSRSRGWWEQCEAARALLHHAVVRGDTRCMGPFERVIAFCRAKLVDPVHGGWFMRVEPDGSVANTDKGNEWKVDYHVVGLCSEAMRLLPP